MRKAHRFSSDGRVALKEINLGSLDFDKTNVANGQGVTDVTVPSRELGGISTDSDFGVEADVLGIGAGAKTEITPGFALIRIDRRAAIEAHIVAPLGLGVGIWRGSSIIWIIFTGDWVLRVDSFVLVEEVTIAVAGVRHGAIDVDAILTSWDLATRDVPRSFVGRGLLGIPFCAGVVPASGFSDI